MTPQLSKADSDEILDLMNPADMSTIRVPDGHLAYRDVGTGKALVLLHAAPWITECGTSRCRRSRLDTG
jgi:hypothetical protein